MASMVVPFFPINGDTLPVRETVKTAPYSSSWTDTSGVAPVRCVTTSFKNRSVSMRLFYVPVHNSQPSDAEFVLTFEPACAILPMDKLNRGHYQMLDFYSNVCYTAMVKLGSAFTLGPFLSVRAFLVGQA